MLTQSHLHITHTHLSLVIMTQTWTFILFFFVQVIIHVNGCSNTGWESNGRTVAGGNGAGDAPNQLNSAYGVFVDSNNVVFVTDYNNHRVVKWTKDATTGIVVAGGHCGNISQGELCYPAAITFDKNNNMYVTVEDEHNGAVIIWREGAKSGETLINSNSSLYGLALDHDEKYLYVTHHREHRVVKYTINGAFEDVVAGGHGNGSDLNQLDYRKYMKYYFYLYLRYMLFFFSISLARGITVDKSGSVFVSDSKNHRIVKWMVNATEGTVVAGGKNNGSRTDQLAVPNGIFVDDKETIFVADNENNRVMRIPAGTLDGTIISGDHQLSSIEGLTFDSHGNLYVADWGNNRVQMFAKDTIPCSGSELSVFFSKWTLLYCFISFIILCAKINEI